MLFKKGFLLFLFFVPIKLMSSFESKTKPYKEFVAASIEKQKELVKKWDVHLSDSNNRDKFICPLHGIESRESYGRHTHLIFSSEQLLRCRDCFADRWYKTFDEFKEHFKQKHQNNFSGWACPACGACPPGMNDKNEQIEFIKKHVYRRHDDLVRQGGGNTWQTFRKLVIERRTEISQELHAISYRPFIQLVVIASSALRLSEYEDLILGGNNILNDI